jgi:NADH:quinone reductase (non-electrogenic)
MTHRIVVLGAGYAGLAAAKRAARQLRNADARVTPINAADRFVERVRLHQLAAGQRLRDLPLRDRLNATRVGLVVAHVTSIDVQAQTVRLSATPHTVGYDTLVYALGSRRVGRQLPGPEGRDDHQRRCRHLAVNARPAAPAPCVRPTANHGPCGYVGYPGD